MHSPRKNYLSSLPTIMREGLIGLRHPMCLFLLLYRVALILLSIHQLSSQFLGHASTRAAACSCEEPAHRQCQTAGRFNFNRNLIRGAADTAGLHFHRRRGVAKRLLENLHWVFLGALLD